MNNITIPITARVFVRTQKKRLKIQCAEENVGEITAKIYCRRERLSFCIGCLFAAFKLSVLGVKSLFKD